MGAQRPRWSQPVKKIMQSINSDIGLLPRELSDGDNNRMIDSLSSDANGWRGLRDIADVLEDMGENEEVTAHPGKSRRVAKSDARCG